MAKDRPTPSWHNFAAWSAVGALFYILVVSGGVLLLHERGMEQAFPSNDVAAKLGLGLILTMVVIGFSSRKQPLNRRTFRNYLILNAVALSFFLLAIWGFGAFGLADGLGVMTVSERDAAGLGLVLIFIASLGSFFVANAYRGAGLIDDEAVAEDLRERGRLYFCSFAWMAACGLLLIVLGLGGPGGLLSPAAALAGTLVLVAILTVLGIVTWRLSDELARTLSLETGNMALYLILGLGGGWAMLAHLGYVAAPVPIDWLTMFTVLLFAASFIVLARRKLLTR